MKPVTCPICNVVTEVPDEATAYKCPNCDALVKNIDGRPTAQDRESANNSPAVKGLVLIIVFIFIAGLLGAFGDSAG